MSASLWNIWVTETRILFNPLARGVASKQHNHQSSLACSHGINMSTWIRTFDIRPIVNPFGYLDMCYVLFRSLSCGSFLSKPRVSSKWKINFFVYLFTTFRFFIILWKYLCETPYYSRFQYMSHIIIWVRAYTHNKHYVFVALKQQGALMEPHICCFKATRPVKE